MRYGGRAETDSGYPRAHAICDRCGKRTNLYKLSWQYDWRGPRLQNLRVLVCQSCYDTPQQSGQRVILLPADPVPVMNARPEQFVPDNNPLSGIGANPNPSRWQYGSIIGNLTDAGGPQAAFDNNPLKPDFMSAMKATSHSSYNNYVGVNWTGVPITVTPSSLNTPVLTHTLTSFTITAPTNSTFGSTTYLVQGSQVGVSGYGAWTTLASGHPAGTTGEEITGTATGGRYQFHRVAFYSAGGTAIAVAQVQFNVAETSSNSGEV